MNKIIYLSFLALLICSYSWAQKTIVWDKPISISNLPMLDITKVELADNETAITITTNNRLAGRQIGFADNTILQADGKDYKIKSIKDYQLNSGINVPADGKLDLVLLFEALPLTTQSISFNMPGAFTITNIHDRNQPMPDLVNTYWRNDATGDWLLGITKDAIIYDSKIWAITSKKENNGAFAISADNGGKSMSININKEKKGQRTFLIGKQKLVCSQITSDFLPDYPSKDTQTTIANNNYRTGDSITIIGWYKDMPKEYWDMSNEFEASFQSIYTDDSRTFSAKLDSLGRFRLRMPVENTQMLYCDWNRSHVMFPAEPNQTYFLLKDYTEGKTLVMGTNVRLQNEYLANTLDYVSIGNYQRVKEIGGAMPYLAYCDSTTTVAMNILNDHLKAHPTLSTAYEALIRNNILAEEAEVLMQGRFSVPNHTLPQEYIDYVTTNCWNKIEEPYTMVGNRYTTFFRDYTGHITDHLPQDGMAPIKYALLKADKEGKIQLSADDKTFIDDYLTAIDSFYKEMRAAPDSLRQQMIYDFNNGPIVKRMNALVARDNNEAIVNEILNLRDYQRLSAAADSLHWSGLQHDMLLSTKLANFINSSRLALRPYLVEFANSDIRSEAARKAVLAIHEKYEAIARKPINTNSIKSSDDLKDISEGEQILSKIIDPYRGKLVLLDIWGTWCGPCKEALSHSQEEYERLKPYDMVFLYLANQSPEESWQNVIKQYNVTGDNVVHYNLPKAQQKAVENFLNVHSFPTYKLFDQKGNLLDVNADPRNLSAFEGLVKRILNK